MRRLLLVLALATGFATAAHAAGPSPEFRASIKRTIELRKKRRQAAEVRPGGVIVPYPLPPDLIIRHRPEVHDEIGAFLDALRRSGG